MPDFQGQTQSLTDKFPNRKTERAKSGNPYGKLAVKTYSNYAIDENGHSSLLKPGATNQHETIKDNTSEFMLFDEDDRDVKNAAKDFSLKGLTGIENGKNDGS